MLTARFDYLQGVCHFETLDDLEAFLDLVSSFLTPADEWAYLDYGLFTGEKFTRSFRSVAGGFRGAFRVEKDESIKAIAFLPGAFMAACQSHRDLVSFLNDCGFGFTRVDLAADDYTRRVTDAQVKEAGDKGDYTMVDTFKYISSGTQSSNQVGTCYFGKTDKVLRFYNAEVMHGISADRWELQVRRDYAAAIVANYLKDPDCLAPLVFQSIDIIDRDLSTWYTVHRYPWWQSLREEAGFAVFPSSSPYQFEITRSIEWLYKQVAPTLAVCRHGFGESAFQSLLEDLVTHGSERFKPHHNAAVVYLQKGEIAA